MIREIVASVLTAKAQKHVIFPSRARWGAALDALVLHFQNTEAHKLVRRKETIKKVSSWGEEIFSAQEIYKPALNAPSVVWSWVETPCRVKKLRSIVTSEKKPNIF